MISSMSVKVSPSKTKFSERERGGSGEEARTREIPDMSGKRIKPHWNFTLTRGEGTAYFLLAFLSAKYGTADPIAGYTATRDVQVSTLAVAVIKLLNPG